MTIHTIDDEQRDETTGAYYLLLEGFDTRWHFIADAEPDGKSFFASKLEAIKALDEYANYVCHVYNQAPDPDNAEQEMRIMGGTEEACDRAIAEIEAHGVRDRPLCTLNDLKLHAMVGGK